VGNPLINERVISAFLAELDYLEKNAGILDSAVNAGRRIGQLVGPRVSQAGQWVKNRPSSITSWAKEQPAGFAEATKRFVNPVYGVKAGLRDLTPADKMKHLQTVISKGGPKAEAAAKEMKSFEGAGRHLISDKQSLVDIARGRGRDIIGNNRNRLTLGAEELSRRGWTGQGNITKYMPVGGKGMLTGFSALAIPDVVESLKKEPTPTGEGGAGETGLRELLGAGSFVAGSGLGLLPAMGLYAAASKAGGGIGRIVDRLRGGADLGTAVSAPSPEEAQDQLQNINRYYG